MAEPIENVEQASLWESWASAWIDSDAWTAMVVSPFGAAAIAALAPAPGARIVDVGCGSGQTTIELARRVAPTGSVLGLDIAPSMIDAAHERARREGVDGVAFRVADAQAHPLGEGAFDAAFSQFGVMFFADPVAAFANIGRSVRDGGRLVFACWQDLFANEWMLLPGAAALGVAGAPPSLPGPGDPGPFSLSDPTVVGDVLTAAGFSDVVVSPMSFTVTVPEDRLGEAVEASCGVGVVRLVLDDTSDPVVEESIRTAIHDALAEKVSDGWLRLDAAAHIVTATRSRPSAR